MPTLSGKVEKVVTGVIKTKVGELNKHDITVNGETVQKLTKVGTNFELPVGTEVQIEFEEQVFTSKSGAKFTNKKIVQNGLVILSDKGAGQSFSAAPQPSVNRNTSFNDGARNGMIVGRAVELAIARKAMKFDGLLEAAKDIVRLVEKVEKNDLTDTQTVDESPF